LFKAQPHDDLFEGLELVHVDAPIAPDPEEDDSFNPRVHDLRAAIELGIDHLVLEAGGEPVFDYDPEIINTCRIASGADDYLEHSRIGWNR